MRNAFPSKPPSFHSRKFHGVELVRRNVVSKRFQGDSRASALRLCEVPNEVIWYLCYFGPFVLRYLRIRLCFQPRSASTARGRVEVPGRAHQRPAVLASSGVVSCCVGGPFSTSFAGQHFCNPGCLCL